MREREERERNAAKVTVTRPVWAQLGGAIASYFQSIILPPFPDKQISMLEKNIMI